MFNMLYFGCARADEKVEVKGAPLGLVGRKSPRSRVRAAPIMIEDPRTFTVLCKKPGLIVAAARQSRKMDAFKILARGTTFQKRPPKNNHLDQLLPSAGGPSNPHILSNGSGHLEEPRRGTKRKRENESVQQNESQNEETPPQAGDAGSEDIPDQTDANNEAEYQPRSEEECRKLLKLHKLKIALLDEDLSIKDRDGKKKKFSQPDESASNRKGSLLRLTPQPLVSFKDLRPRFNISRRLAENLDRHGFAVPTEIQLAAIPILLGTDEDRGLSSLYKKKKDRRSHVDLLTIAPTGSGKTLAYLIPTIQGILHLRYRNQTAAKEGLKNDYVKAIVLAPTHELVDQIVNETRKLIAGTAVKVAAMRKGMHIGQAEPTPLQPDDTTQTTVVKADII
ncbi:MAG: hypothetical protein LQ340_007633, partial [Diploschistes diacapsis]